MCAKCVKNGKLSKAIVYTSLQCHLYDSLLSTNFFKNDSYPTTERNHVSQNCQKYTAISAAPKVLAFAVQTTMHTSLCCNTKFILTTITTQSDNSS
jgi:hypothetical protein